MSITQNDMLEERKRVFVCHWFASAKEVGPWQWLRDERPQRACSFGE